MTEPEATMDDVLALMRRVDELVDERDEWRKLHDEAEAQCLRLIGIGEELLTIARRYRDLLDTTIKHAKRVAFTCLGTGLAVGAFVAWFVIGGAR